MLILNRRDTRAIFLAAVDWNQVGVAWRRGQLVAKTRPSARSKLEKVLIVLASTKFIMVSYFSICLVPQIDLA